MSDVQRQQLETFAQFLASEGMEAGGIGPHELVRLYDRHIADSLAFLALLPEEEGCSIADIGAGVGLPGVPIAIGCPSSHVLLFDRSQRRCDLARRGSRIAGVENVSVRQADVATVRDRFDVVVFRASLPLVGAIGLAPQLLEPGGRAIIAVSRQDERPDISGAIAALPAGWATELHNPAGAVLDSPTWLLRMSPL
jgi:16S rRNA (guanine527-N7)-methyltransferase